MHKKTTYHFLKKTAKERQNTLKKQGYRASLRKYKGGYKVTKGKKFR